MKRRPRLPKLKPPKMRTRERFQIQIDEIRGYCDERKGMPWETGFVVNWSDPSLGFGTLMVSNHEEKGLVAYGECMSQEFCEAVMLAVAKSWKLVC